MSCNSYKYRAINSNGDIIHGEIIAKNAKDATSKLTKKHLTVIKLIRKLPTIFVRIPSQQFNDFIRQLASLINSNIPILMTLKIIEQNQKNRTLKKLLRRLQIELNSGETLSTALKKYPHYFDSLLNDLVYVGEQSGTLPQILGYIAMYKEKSISIKRKIKKALLYPTAILVTASVVTGILLIFIVPQFAKLFQGFGATLPIYTQLIIKIANFLKKSSPTIILIIIGLIMIIKIASKFSTKFSAILERITFKIPILGINIKKAILARFSLILAITYKAGLPLTDSLQIAANIVNSSNYRKAILKAHDSIQQGHQLTKALTNTDTKLFPARVKTMLAIGEEGGTLAEMLTKISQYYEEELNYLLENINNLLEPLIMVILGLVVGGLIIGMYLPIFRLGTIL